MATSQDFVNWVCGPLLVPHYLKYVLLAERDSLLRFASGTTHQTIYYPEAKAFHALLPPPDEQRAIAHILGALDDKIELNRRMNETLEEMARALFKSWFVDFDPVHAKAEGRKPNGMDSSIAKLFPSEFEDSELGGIPRGWKNSTLGAEAARCGGSIQTGPFGCQLHASDYVDVGVPVIMPQDISQRRVVTTRIVHVHERDAKRLERHRVQAGDIVYSRRGDVERHALISKRENGWLCGTGCLLVRLGTDWVSPLYASLQLDRPETRAWIKQRAIGATMPNLNTSIIASVPLLVPPDELLHRFHLVASNFDARIAANAEENNLLASIRDTLAPRLLSGALQIDEAHRFVERSQ